MKKETNNITDELKELAEAFTAHLANIARETKAKDVTRKSYYRLQRAEEAIRERKREILERTEILYDFGHQAKIKHDDTRISEQVS